MQQMINKIFIQSHQCEKAKNNDYILEQYKDSRGSINWYLIKDSFLDAIKVNQCPYCKLILPAYSYLESEIEEVSLLINSKEISTDEFLTKVELVQDWIDTKNILAYVDKAADKVQIRWDEKINNEELINVYIAVKEEYQDVKIGVYFDNYVERKINDFPISVNFVEMDLEEYLLSVLDKEKCVKIS